MNRAAALADCFYMQRSLYQGYCTLNVSTTEVV